MNVNLSLDKVKDAARGVALDVWEDLGRTRLAGVAVGLTIGLLAITAIALHPGGAASDVQASSPIITPAPVENDVDFTVPREDPLTMADIELSSPRDPFQSLGGLAESNQTLLAAGEEIIDSVMGFESGSSAAAGGGDTASLMPIGDLGSTPTTAPADEPQGDFGGATHEPESEPVPTTDYSYVADVQFGKVDDLRRYKTVQRLGLIPSRKLPMIMYLGVSDDHETAVFMVDSRLSQGGEGTCVPRDSLCTFLELQASPAHDEHHFMDADGNEYLLRLRGVTRTDASNGTLTGRDVSALRGSPPVVDGDR